MAVMLVSELSDMFDGMAARRLNQVTDLGKVLDPLADSLSRMTVFVCFAVAGIAPVFLVLLMLYRDGVVGTLRILCADRGLIVAARASGKMKAVAQAVAILGILGLRLTVETEMMNERTAAVWILMSIAAAVTVWSAFDYWIGTRNQLKSVKSKGPNT